MNVRNKDHFNHFLKKQLEQWAWINTKQFSIPNEERNAMTLRITSKLKHIKLGTC